MEQLVHAWDVLATMTPPEYSAIRPYLAQSSGFQSWQYRSIEFSLGNKNAAMRKPHEHRPDLLRERRRPARAHRSTMKRCGCWRARACRCRPAHGARLDPAVRSERRRRAGLAVGLSRPENHWDLYQLGEELTDLEGRLPALALPPRDDRRARDRVQARHRRHGRRRYLRKMLDVVLFPEIWKLRTDL
jgi:tryptophan 2,3-dioxygenase